MIFWKVGDSLLRTILINVMCPIPLVEQGSAANISLEVEFFPNDLGIDPLEAKRVSFCCATVQLQLTAALKVLREAGPPPEIGADHAMALSLAQAGRHDQAAIAFLRLAARGDAPVVAIYGLATQLFLAGKARQARQIAQFVAAIWTDDPRPLAIYGTILGALNSDRAAHNFLAKAAHMARRAPEFRGVLRFSQRELLKLQFHDQADPIGREA